MTIKKIKIRNFCNFENIEMEFSKGLVVLKGPNEAGKSSLLNALKLSVFGDATSSSAEIQMQKRWNSDELFLLEVHFQDDNGTFIISRDYENKKNILNLPDGTTLKDKKRIQEKITKLIGLPSEKCFLSTICISQDEIKKIDAGLPEIKKLLEEKISGGEVDLNEILKSLDKENKELKKAGPKNPGLIKRAENKRNELESQITHLKEKVHKLENYRIELSQVSEKLPKLKEDTQLKIEAIENAKKYLDKKKHYDGISKKYDEIEKTIIRRKTSEEKLKTLSARAEILKKELNNKKEKLRKGQEFIGLFEKKDIYTREIKKLSSDIKKITTLEKELAHIEKEISKKKEIDKKDYRNAPLLRGEIDNFKKALSAQEITVSLLPKKKFTLLFKIDDLDQETQELKVKEKTKITGKTHVQLAIDDLVDISILSKGEKIQVILEELRRKESNLRSIFRRYNATNIEELENIWNELQGLKESINNKTIEYKAVLNNRKINEIKNKRNEYLKQRELLDNDLNKIKRYSISIKTIEDLEEGVKKLSKQYEKLKEEMYKNKGALEELKEEDKLEEERKAVAKELAIYKAELEKLEIFKCTGEEFMKKESELKKLKENLSKLEARKEFLEMVIKENENIGVEDIADLEEKSSFKEEEIYKLKRKIEIDNIISEMLFSARIQTIRDISDNLSRKIGENLSYITSGRYNKIRLGENLDIKLWSDKKGNWIDAQNPYQELSSGTLDQLYLAARFALTEILIPGKNLPIFMDDPFTHFDSERRTRVLELCKKLSEKHQILIFTCFDYSDEFAEKILKVSEIT